jgi:hypothetical protein
MFRLFIGILLELFIVSKIFLCSVTLKSTEISWVENECDVGYDNFLIMLF